MATTPNSIITVQTPKLDLLSLSTANGVSTPFTLSQGASNGTKIVGLLASNGDSAAAHLLSVGISRSGGAVQIFAATNIPLSAGFANSVPPVNILSTAIWPGLPIDSDGNPFLFLQSTLDALQCLYATTLQSAAVINVAAVRGDF
jgi:hypothetical protein